MSRRCGFVAALAILCLAAIFGSASAEWIKDGVPVCSEDFAQYGAVSCPDDSGRVIYVWMDQRNGYDTDLYATKIDVNGESGPGSLPVCTAPNWQGSHFLISDGAGGGFIAWADERDGTRRIYVQWIDGMGTAHFGENGIPACDTVVYQDEPKLVGDGAGGIVVIWSDYRSGGWDVYAQRIGPDGSLLWDADGVPVCAAPGDQYNGVIAADGTGGWIVGWVDQRSYDGGDIYAQRIDASGAVLWSADGEAVCAEAGTQQQVRVVGSSLGGAIFAWNDYRNYNSSYYADWVTPFGPAGWGTAGGVAVSTGSWNMYGAAIAGDGMGGLYVAWYDERDGWNYPIYAQHVDVTGMLLWGENGALSLFNYSYSNDLVMRGDGMNGAIFAGDIYRDEESSADILAQKLGPAGASLWGPQGVMVCEQSADQYMPTVAPDGQGGAYIAWEDYRAGDPDIYCQHFGASGLWGRPAPVIVSCADVPSDQGGWVRIRTRASAHDAIGGIVGYNVWRLIEGGGGPIMTLGEALPRLLDPAKAVGVRLAAKEAATLGLPEGDWESVGFWFATRDTVYNIAVPTKNDSTEAGTAWETFIVTAHSTTAGAFAPSEPVMGYSIDNLAPGATPEFAGTESADPAGLVMTWSRNAAPDAWRYDVYRGSDEFFVPEPSNLVGSTEELTLLDPTWHHSYMYFFKLVAVDRHGNAGPPALLRPEDINVGMMLQSFAATLRGTFIEVAWTIAATDEAYAFAVSRAVGDGEFAAISSADIAHDGLSFAFVDRGVEPGTTYRYRVSVMDEGGARVLFETGAVSTPAMPLALHQNHPNPFNPSTTITYYLPEASVVTLDVYSADGKLVARLVDREAQARGTHTARWSGLDARGSAVSSGVYFYRLQAGKETLSRKMVLMR